MSKVFLAFVAGLWLGLTNLFFHVAYWTIILVLVGYVLHLKGVF